jgi:uncharacterized protein
MNRRYLSGAFHKIEVRSGPDGKPLVAGYAAVYYREGDKGTEFELMHYRDYRVLERLMPGCFDRALREDDVRALVNHDPSLILGRTTSGTLRLSLDSVGLRYEIAPPDTQYARDLIESLKRGDITGSSFSFDYVAKTIRMEQDGDNERDIVEVREAKLYDVSPVTFPAYSATSAGVRSADLAALKTELEAFHAERHRNAAAKSKRARAVELG